MKRLTILVPMLLATALSSTPARADVQSCTNQVVNEINSKILDYKGGKVVATEVHKGMNYHLIFLDGGWKQVELVIKENSNTCVDIVYNPTGDYVDYSKLMPAPVAQKLFKEKSAYSKALWEAKQKAGSQ